MADKKDIVRSQISELNLECLAFKRKMVEQLSLIDLSLRESLCDMVLALNKFLEKSLVFEPAALNYENLEKLEKNIKKEEKLTPEELQNGFNNLLITQLNKCEICRDSENSLICWKHGKPIREEMIKMKAFSEHSSSSQSSTIKENNYFPKVPRNRTKYSNDLRNLLNYRNLEALTNCMVHRNNSLVPYNRLSYERLFSNLRETLKIRFFRINIYPCGSQMLGIADVHSDLDLFIDTGTFFKKPARKELESLVLITQRILKKSLNYSDFSAVTRARTPILKVFSKLENVDLDLSFGNGLSYCNTKLLLYYFELQPVARHMVLFLKFWSKQCDIPMTGYLVALLVVFFLQVFQKLPSVAYLQRFSVEFLVDGWQAEFMRFSRDHLKIHEEFDLKRLLHDFFKYYGHVFDYERYIVCPYLGEPVKKAIFDRKNSNQLTGLFDRYKNYMDHLNLKKADKIQDLFAYTKPFVVQDPYEHIHNVSKNFHTEKTRKFKDLCRQSWAILGDQIKY